MIFIEPFHSQDPSVNSPYSLSCSSYDVSLENLAIDQPIIPYLTFFFILTTWLHDIVLTM